MANDALSTFIENTRANFGPLTTDLVASVRAKLKALTAAGTSEPWLRALHEESPTSKELYRDPTHGFLLLAHSEATELYRPPHDHGDGWVIYALQRGEMEISTYARVRDADGHIRLVKRDVSALRAGEARIYLPFDIHDTRCVNGPSLLFRFTDRDLKQEDQQGRLTRYVSRNGEWTTGSSV
jgi:hypothetical protein